MDHTVPILALICEYFVMNPVFVRRHIWIYLFFSLVYFINNIIFVANGFQPYGEFNNWKSFKGIAVPIVGFILSVLVFYFMDWATRQKLMILSKNGKSIYSLNSQQLCKILTEKEYDAIEGYKFSQFSTGDASLSGSNKKFNKDLMNKSSNFTRKINTDQVLGENSTGGLSHNTIDLDHGDNSTKSNAMFSAKND